MPQRIQRSRRKGWRLPEGSDDVERLTHEQNSAVRKYLDGQRPKMTQEQWSKSYQSWAHGGNGWRVFDGGGTDIQTALTWYQHIHRPGSKEWRPSVILRELLAEVSRCPSCGTDGHCECV